MPTWARPSDIHFDHEAAAAALEAVVRTRSTLEFWWSAEDRSAQTARSSWEGRAADAFGRSHGARRTLTEDVAARLDNLAAALVESIDDALAEQSRIDALQAEWDAEQRRERQAAMESAASRDPAPARSGVHRAVEPGTLR